MKINKIIKSFFITIFIFLFLASAQIILQNIDFLNPIETALSDFDIFDIYFSSIKTKSSNYEIIIVDISKSDRYEIGKIVDKINDSSPKVIGIDALFRKLKNPSSDSVLAKIFSETKNLVLVNELAYSDLSLSSHDTIKTSHPLFTTHSTQGFANFPNKESKGFKTIRTFYHKKDILDSTVYSFTAEILRKYDYKKFNILDTRNNSEEIINYIGDIDYAIPSFFYVTANEILNDVVDSEIFKDKIVLLGTAIKNEEEKVLGDIFFSPLNDKYAGKTFPDIYGVVIHANILATAIENNYINVLDNSLNFVLSFILTFLTVIIFYNIKESPKYSTFYEGITKILSVIFLLIILFILFIILINLNLKIDFNILFFSIALSSDLLELYLFFESLIIKFINKPKIIRF